MSCRLFAVLAFAGVLSACSSSSSGFDLTQFMTADANASVKTRLRACLVSEANSKFQAGTLFVNTLSATADEMTNTCMKKLALQSAGISEDSQSMASTILQNFQNYGSAQ